MIETTSQLWPEWRNSPPPIDGSWFIARRGLSWQVARCRYDASKVIPGMAASDRIIGAFVDPDGAQVVVSQWSWDSDKASIPPEKAPTLNEVAPGLLELNGAALARERYAALFTQINGDHADQ